MNKKMMLQANHEKLAATAKALAHPARVRIVEILAKRNSCICGEIVDLLPLSQSTVSQHLKELKKAGFIKGEVDGPRICYCLREDALKKAEIMFSEFFVGLNNKVGIISCPVDRKD